MKNRTVRVHTVLASLVAAGVFSGCAVDTLEGGTVRQELAFGGTAAAIPGRIEAENYDTEGAGVAYNDTTAGNSGGQHRTGNVDIQVSSQGGFNVGWIAAGEWLDYTVSVENAGAHSVSVSVASQSAGGTFHLEAGGQDVSGPITFAATGGWQAWTTVVVEDVVLPAGVFELRLVADSSGFNIDYLDFEFTGTPADAQTPYNGSAVNVPGTIQAENYDEGGADVAYADSTVGNSGAQHRDDDVDVEASSQGGFNVGWMAAGEWLEYTVNSQGGTFDVTLSVASLTSGGTVHFEVNGQDVSGPISFGATGGWQVWTEVSGQLTLPSGTSVLRLVSQSSGFNVDWISLSSDAPETSDPTCSTGILNAAGTACCAAACGSCGGTGCDARPGGAANCCTSGVTAGGASCSGSLPPCVMGGSNPPPPPPPSPTSGDISPYLVGNNVWYNPGGDVWDAIAPAGLQIVRIGGHQFDDSVPSNSQLAQWVNEIKALGAEPMIQVSQYESAQSAADIVRYFNVQTGNTVKYWNIGNEPWLQAGQPSTSSVAPWVSAYIKSHASAMKAVDPTIKIFAPDASWYIPDLYNALLGGANDVAGKDANGNYYIDGISWHRYAQTGDLANGLISNIQAARSRVDFANNLHGRTGDSALQFGIGEFNSNASGGQTCSFLNGQEVARVYGALMEYRGFYGALWSMKEGGSNCGGTDFGFLNGDNSPRSSYYHMQMVSHHFTGDYADGSDNIGSLYAFGAKDSNKVAVMLINEGGSQACNVRLNGDGVGGSCQVNIAAGIPVTYAQSIGGNTTMVLEFNLQGQLTKRITYSGSGAPVEQNF